MVQRIIVGGPSVCSVCWNLWSGIRSWSVWRIIRHIIANTIPSNGVGGFRATLEWFLARLGRCRGPVCQHDDLERNTSRRRIGDEHLSHRRQVDQGGNGRCRNATSTLAFLGKMVRGHCISRARSPGWLIILESLKWEYFVLAALIGPGHSLPPCCLEHSQILLEAKRSSWRKMRSYDNNSLSFVHEKHCSAMSMAEYHMTKKNRRVVKDQVVNFTNGCPK